ncbi:unnamed protein product [Stenotrophomonas maltophilia]|nr:unnamed protein product [Stenotrophomonas maltophilia]
MLNGMAIAPRWGWGCDPRKTGGGPTLCRAEYRPTYPAFKKKAGAYFAKVRVKYAFMSKHIRKLSLFSNKCLTVHFLHPAGKVPAALTSAVVAPFLNNVTESCQSAQDPPRITSTGEGQR